MCKTRVHGNEKMNLPCAFKKCTGSLHLTPLMSNGENIYKCSETIGGYISFPTEMHGHLKNPNT